jgi:glutaredoxin
MLSLLSRWTRPRPAINVAHLEVTVYTRAGCCCCHEALDLLKEYQARHRFMLRSVDIDADPVLAERYNTEVPVVAVDGNVRFKGVVNRVLFERLLVAEARDRGH